MTQFQRSGSTGKPEDPKAAKFAPVGDAIRVETEDGFYGFVNYLYHEDPNTEARIVDATVTVEVETVEREAKADAGGAEAIDASRGSGVDRIRDTAHAIELVAENVPGYGTAKATKLAESDPVKLMKLAGAFA